MDPLREFLWPYIASQVVSLLLLWASVTHPRRARLLFALLFGAASIINVRTVAVNPAAYLQYAHTAIPLYSRFIEGWFSKHIPEVVALIALGQAGIAVALIMQGKWVQLGCIGGILFLLAIAPLGVGSAFPFSLATSYALFIILRRDSLLPLLTSRPTHARLRIH